MAKGGFRLNEVNGEAKQVAKDFKRAEKQVKRGEGVRGGDSPSGARTTDTSGFDAATAIATAYDGEIYIAGMTDRYALGAVRRMEGLGVLRP